MIRALAAALILGVLPSAVSAEPFGFPLAPVEGGKPVSLSAFKDKMLLVELWQTHCEPCKVWRPFFEKTQASFRDRGLVVMSVDSGEDAKTVQSYLKAHPSSLRQFLDPEQKVSAALKTNGVPTVALIGTDGALLWAATGFGPSTEADLLWRIGQYAPVSAALPMVKP